MRPKASEVEHLLGANGKIREMTRWTPEYDLEKGLAETVKWFREPSNLARYKPSIYNT